MKKLWYVYILSHPDKVSDTGRPLPGKTCNFRGRLSRHNKKLEGAIMTPIAIFDTEEEAFKYEQDLRVEHGWKREQPLDAQRKRRQKGAEGSKSKEARNKKSIASKKTWENQYYRNLRSEAMEGNQNAIGYKHTKESIEKIRKSSLGNQNGVGYKHTNEAKHACGSGFRGVKRPIVTCPHCEKQGANNLMKRYHFDNCKYKK